jgi:hypothetical protein
MSDAIPTDETEEQQLVTSPSSHVPKTGSRTVSSAEAKQARLASDASADPSVARHRVKVPAFMVHEEVGLGDAIKRVTSRVGIRPCSGCEQRASALNRWMRFGPR